MVIIFIALYSSSDYLSYIRYALYSISSYSFLYGYSYIQPNDTTSIYIRRVIIYSPIGFKHKYSTDHVFLARFLKLIESVIQTNTGL